MNSPGPGYRWNPPPNWPSAPDGWVMPKDWQPDPVWGPAPEGWEFWSLNDKAVSAFSSQASPEQKRTQNKKTLKVVGGILGALVLTVIVGSAIGGGSKTPTAAATQAPTPSAADQASAAQAQADANAEAQAVADAAAAAAAPPTKADFKLTVKTLSKNCFGSAGCNVTYRVVPTYIGTGDAKNLEVTYEVLGGDSGATVATFTIDGAGTATYDSANTISTASSATVLKARVTDVTQTP